MGDLDVGECFLNFILHPTLRPYAGVDFTLFFPTAGSMGPKGASTAWETWLRASTMGLKSSPYQAVQALGFAKAIICGDRRDPRNIFRWGRVRLNLRGAKHTIRASLGFRR
jgi:hypothetical protein